MDTIKPTEMKEKLRKEYFKSTRKHYSQNLMKRKFLGNSKILWIVVKMLKGGTQNHRPKDQEIDDDAAGLAQKRWHKQTLCN